MTPMCSERVSSALLSFTAQALRELTSSVRVSNLGVPKKRIGLPILELGLTTARPWRSSESDEYQEVLDEVPGSTC